MGIIVRPGDWWAAGPHRFICGDVAAGALLSLVARLPEPAAFVYTDPPWGPANIQYWRTLAGRAGGDPVPTTFSVLLQAIADGIVLSGAPVVWIESGVRWSGAVRTVLGPLLPPLAGEWTVTYGRPPRPNRLLGFSATPIDGTAEGLHGFAVTAWAFDRSAVPGGIVVDPCVGRGMTARFAHRHGMACWGCEFNPARLAVTLDWLDRHGAPAMRLPVRWLP